MDQLRVADLTRSVSGVLPRRGVLRGLLGAGCGFGALRLSDAAAKRKNKQKKRKKRKPSQRCDVCRRGCAFTSVQAAIDAANPEDTVRLSPGTYPEHVYVEKDLTILGAGAGRSILDGGGIGGAAVLSVYGGAIVRVRGLTVRGGNNTVGGGIHNEGALTLEGVHVTANTAGDGGGIYSFVGASLRLIDSRVSGNEAGVGGGLNLDGGIVRLDGSQVTGNKAVNGGLGGGFHINNGTVILNGSQVTGNEATGAGSQGGGFYVFNGVVTLNGTPVTGNTAAAGGGIYKAGNAAVTVAPGSVTGNTPTNCAGEAVTNCAN